MKQNSLSPTHRNIDTFNNETDLLFIEGDWVLSELSEALTTFGGNPYHFPGVFGTPQVRRLSSGPEDNRSNLLKNWATLAVTEGIEDIVSVGAKGRAKVGDFGTAISGNFGVSEAGRNGKDVVGRHGRALAGSAGTTIEGDRSYATAGPGGRVSAGEGGTIRLSYVNEYVTILVIGHTDGHRKLKANTPYELDRNGNFVSVA